MPKLSFRWNLPYEWDEGEPECVVTFFYSPGCKCEKSDCDCVNGDDEDVVEDIHVLYDGEDWDEDQIEAMPGDNTLVELRDACLAYVEDYDGDQPREE